MASSRAAADCEDGGQSRTPDADAWDSYIAQRLSFLPKKDATITDVVKAAEQQSNFLDDLDIDVAARFVRCDERTASQRLNLSSLDLTDVPIRTSLFSTLKVLSLRDNRLSTLALEIFAMSRLETLIVSHNELTAIPDSISALLHLRRFSVAHNKLEGPLTPALLLCSNLTELDVSSNLLTSLPTHIGSSLPRLTTLLIADNNIRVLPPDLWRLRRLASLDIRNNPLDLRIVPDRVLVLGDEYELARSRSQRKVMVSRAVAMRDKLLSAYKKNLIESLDRLEAEQQCRS